MKRFNLFYSWQSDDNKGRKTLTAGLKNSIKKIKEYEGYEVTIDEATRDLPGTPQIDQSIFDKIDKCDIFLCDITPVCSYEKKRKNETETVLVPNPNVLIELGYAMSAVGKDYVITVAHDASWNPKYLPFDINHKRIGLFNSQKCDFKDHIMSVIQHINKHGKHRQKAKPYFLHKVTTYWDKIKAKLFDKEFDYFEGKATEASTVFFRRRMAQAFPGERGLKEYTKTKDIKRALKELFAQPLSFNKAIGDGETDPIWYFRGGSSLHIDKFRHLGGRCFLIGWDELEIKRIVAFVDNGRYYGNYVYIEAKAMKPTGLYSVNPDNVASLSEEFGYYDEEYAIYKWLGIIPLKVRKQEEDDGHASRWSMTIKLRRDRLETRVRYLTDYNMIVAAKGSPFNCSLFDITSGEKFCNLLKDKISIEDFNNYMSTFPKRQ